MVQSEEMMSIEYSTICPKCYRILKGRYGACGCIFCPCGNRKDCGSGIWSSTFKEAMKDMNEEEEYRYLCNLIDIEP